MIRKTRTEKNFASNDEGSTSIAASLNRIFKKVEEDGLSEDAANQLIEDIRNIVESFSVSPKAAVLLAAIVEKASSNRCDEEALANFIGCTNIEFISFRSALREMEDSGMIAVSSNHRKTIAISVDALKAIEKNIKYEPVKITELSTDELFTKFRLHFVNFRKDIIDAERLSAELSKLIERNQQLLFCRKVSESNLFQSCSESERRMFLFICHRYVSNGNKSVPIDVLMNFTDYMEDDLRLRRLFSNSNSNLQNAGLVTFGIENGYADESTLSLSDDVKRTFFDEIQLAKEETVRHKDLISCDSIKEQQLFYNAEEGKQIDRLASLLEDGNFRKVQERLESEGMPKGLACVFHGCPGSGKTASLKALAKRTGRDIFWVDLAGIKSKWVGESEANLKKLFSDYRALVRTSAKAPILAVNEADAIFTKRITNVEQSSDNMYNAMTDIILNELETLDGILIATTNLVGNMMDKKDSAMERRFLFKVEFKTPDSSVRAKIWKAKLKSLSDADAELLAKKFVFSGGNIENIARKSTVDYVLSGSRPDLDTLIGYCEEEKISRDETGRKHIGF